MLRSGLCQYDAASIVQSNTQKGIHPVVRIQLVSLACSACLRAKGKGTRQVPLAQNNRKCKCHCNEHLAGLLAVLAECSPLLFAELCCKHAGHTSVFIKRNKDYCRVLSMLCHRLWQPVTLLPLTVAAMQGDYALQACNAMRLHAARHLSTCSLQGSSSNI